MGKNGEIILFMQFAFGSFMSHTTLIESQNGPIVFRCDFQSFARESTCKQLRKQKNIYLGHRNSLPCSFARDPFRCTFHHHFGRVYSQPGRNNRHRAAEDGRTDDHAACKSRPHPLLPSAKPCNIPATCLGLCWKSGHQHREYAFTAECTNRASEANSPIDPLLLTGPRA